MTQLNKDLQDRLSWNSKWIYLFKQYQADLRHGYYIASLLKNQEWTVLEIGAGSFRDIALLGRLGYSIGGLDFSELSCEKVKMEFPEFSERFWCGDAFNTNLNDNEYDVSYSNGFIGCFDDLQIDLLLKEQVRITKKIIISTVHNAHNIRFREYFDNKTAVDSIYSLRFFTINEISNIFKKLDLNFVIYPVGKAYVAGEDLMIKDGASMPEIREYIISQNDHALEASERLMVVAHKQETA